MTTHGDYLVYAEAMATLHGIDRKRAQAVGLADQKLTAALTEADRHFELEKRSFDDVSREVRSADSAMLAVFRKLGSPPIDVGNPAGRLSSMKDVQRVAHEQKVWAERAEVTVQSLRRTLARLEAQPRVLPPVPRPPAPPENPNKMYIVAVVVAATILLIMLLIAFT